MTEHPGRRRNIPGDPTAEPASDPVPTGEDVVGGEDHEVELDTPRRYDEPADDVVLPSEAARTDT
jgi:hypothetical protein